MEAQVLNSSQKEINLSIQDGDIGILYLIQHELLKSPSVDFAGVIMKHPLTNECWMRVTSPKSSPLKEITKATESAIKVVEDFQKLLNSKIKGN